MGKFDLFSTLLWQKWNMSMIQCQFKIWKSSVIWSLKIWLFELFNYLIWCKTKNVQLISMFVSDNWISFLIQIFVLILQKWIEFKKSIWHKNTFTETFSNMITLHWPCPYLLSKGSCTFLFKTQMLIHVVQGLYLIYKGTSLFHKVLITFTKVPCI